MAPATATVMSTSMLRVWDTRSVRRPDRATRNPPTTMASRKATSAGTGAPAAPRRNPARVSTPAIATGQSLRTRSTTPGAVGTRSSPSESVAPSASTAARIAGSTSVPGWATTVMRPVVKSSSTNSTPSMAPICSSSSRAQSGQSSPDTIRLRAPEAGGSSSKPARRAWATMALWSTWTASYSSLRVAEATLASAESTPGRSCRARWSAVAQSAQCSPSTWRLRCL